MAANGKRDQILLWYLDVICRIILLIWNKLLWLYTRMKWHQNLDLSLSPEIGSWISLLHFCEFAFYFEAFKLCLTSCEAEQSSLDSKCCWSCYWNRTSPALCLLLKMWKGSKVIRVMIFNLAQLSKFGHLEVLMSLLYNSRGICSFSVCSIVVPFELQKPVRAILSATDLSVCPRTLKLERMKVNKRIICLIPKDWTETWDKCVALLKSTEQHFHCI